MGLATEVARQRVTINIERRMVSTLFAFPFSLLPMYIIYFTDSGLSSIILTFFKKVLGYKI